MRRWAGGLLSLAAACTSAEAQPELISGRSCGMIVATAVSQIPPTEKIVYVDRIIEREVRVPLGSEDAAVPVTADAGVETSSVATSSVGVAGIGVVVSSTIGVVVTSSVVVDVSDGAKWVSIGGIPTKIEGVL